jgi:hypothetical protein
MLLAIVSTLVVTALATHWVDRNTEVRRDEVSGKELAAAAEWLNEFYASPEGLQRPAGLCEGGRFDTGALAAWVFDAYMQARRHSSPQDARQSIVTAIQSSDEWKQKHR